MPFLGGKQVLFSQKQRKEKNTPKKTKTKENNKKTNKEGLGPSEVARSHLTLKPSKKEQK